MTIDSPVFVMTSVESLLVFSAGTIQWDWGLSDNHLDGFGTTSDPSIQQATVNLLADMTYASLDPRVRFDR